MTNSCCDPKPCCPKFDPKPWDEKSFEWKNKLFIKDSMPTFFHIPWPPTIGKLMEKMWNKALDAKAAPEIKDFLMLAHDPTAFRCDYYMAVTKEIPGADNVTLNGKYITKVFDGPYSAAPKWLKEMESYLKSKSKVSKKFYFYYTTCPKCAKIYGHNYIVAIVETN